MITNELGLHIGQWVTQYYAGYWRIVDIIPKYADCDFQYDDMSYKKGDQCGYWALMIKGFTPKMKFRLDSAYCDILWCKPVSTEESERIEDYFSDHPKDLDAFSKYQYVDRPSVASLWLNLNEQEESLIKDVITHLPCEFTKEYFVSAMTDAGLSRVFTKPPTSHLLTLRSSVWKLDEQKRKLYKDPELKKL